MRNIIAGNWKMNCTKQEAEELLDGIKQLTVDNASTIVFVPAIHLQLAESKLSNSTTKVGAQNCYKKQSGAFTGEISPKQLKSYAIPWVLLGHSERRSIFNETNQELKEKVNAALSEGLHIMFCIGETKEEREAGNAENIVRQQLEESIFDLSSQEMENIAIAYEPVWAIGTGLAATPQQAQDMHAFIRSLLTEKYGRTVADNTSILYGGSVKPTNAKEIFSNKDIDGGLIGGASLKTEDFTKIVQAI